MTIKNLTDESRFTKEQLIAHITPKLARIKPHSQVNDNLRNEALMNKRVLEIALAALTDEHQLNTANLINKFYQRYPLATFSFDTERAEALGYFMAGAEIQCFGKFIEYEGGAE